MNFKKLFLYFFLIASSQNFSIASDDSDHDSSSDESINIDDFDLVYAERSNDEIINHDSIKTYHIGKHIYPGKKKEKKLSLNEIKRLYFDKKTIVPFQINDKKITAKDKNKNEKKIVNNQIKIVKNNSEVNLSGTDSIFSKENTPLRWKLISEGFFSQAYDTAKENNNNQIKISKKIDENLSNTKNTNYDKNKEELIDKINVLMDNPGFDNPSTIKSVCISKKVWF